MRKRVLIAAFAVFMGVFGFNVKTMAMDPADSEVEDGDRKPVIYLYPEEDDTEVSVSLSYNGELTQLVPEFDWANTWTVTADTDGTITDAGIEYPYLIWEGVPNYKYDFYSGYCIKGSETENFLNCILSEMGLNENEKSEFIEYWLPQMRDNEFNVISFQGKTYLKGAKLNITPQPDTMIRVFMAWYPSDKYVKIKPQYVDTAKRKGFTVVEWGGNKVK